MNGTNFVTFKQIVWLICAYDFLVRSSFANTLVHHTPASVNVTTTANPAVSSLETNSEQVTSEEFRQRLQRARNDQMSYIRQHVLDSLGWTDPPEIDRQMKEELLQNLSTPMFVSRHKHCYYPACDIPLVSLPNYVNRSLWFDTYSRNLRVYFNLPNERDPNLSITSAVIKLHLKRREGCQCGLDNGEPTTSRVHIKLYKYIRPVRTPARLRPRNKRLIDAKMVTWDGERWVTLQVTDAVIDILSGSRRNGGFEIQVGDMNENVIDTSSIFHPTVCSAVTDFDCSEEAPVNQQDLDDISDLNKSPVLEVSSTSTTRFVVSN